MQKAYGKSFSHNREHCAKMIFHKPSAFNIIMHINISLYQDSSELKSKDQFNLNGTGTPHKPKLI